MDGWGPSGESFLRFVFGNEAVERLADLSPTGHSSEQDRRSSRRPDVVVSGVCANGCRPIQPQHGGSQAADGGRLSVTARRAYEPASKSPQRSASRRWPRHGPRNEGRPCALRPRTAAVRRPRLALKTGSLASDL